MSKPFSKISTAKRPTNVHRNVEVPEQHPPSPEEQVRKTDEAVANAGGATTIPKHIERWSEVQRRQFSKPVDKFRWSEVPSEHDAITEESS